MSNSGRSSSNEATRILIVDDHPLLREGLAARITSQPDWVVCGEAASVDEALAQIKQTHPDLAIVDIQLSGSHGLELIKQLHDDFPEIRTLVVSAYDESLYGERALRAGIALQTVLAGQRYMSTALTRQLVSQAISGKGASHSDPVQTLSDRELEVFQLIGRGETTGAIARQLHLSTNTIDTHREKLRRKLGVKTGAELMQRAVQWVLENGG